MVQKKRVLLAKIGLDGHDRALKILAKMFGNAGMEVVYLGLFQSAESVAKTAIDEDVDIIGISILDGGQTLIGKDLLDALEERKGLDIKVVFGGVIPEKDITELKEMGISAVFTPGSPIDDIIRIFNEL